MSTVNDVTAKAQQAIFDKFGINQAKQNQELGAKQTLGQEDFLKLMTTQLQNQDPLLPWKMVTSSLRWRNSLPYLGSKMLTIHCLDLLVNMKKRV